MLHHNVPLLRNVKYNSIKKLYKALNQGGSQHRTPSQAISSIPPHLV